MKKISFLYLLTAGILAGTALAPANVNAVNNYSYNESGYYDEYGNYIEPVVYDETAKDTSWFDYEHPKKVYKIGTEGELIGFASLVNEQQTDRWKPSYFETFEGVTIELTDDIELTKPWKPIGPDKDVCFKGIFDGKGHSISGIKVDTNAATVGLFGYLDGTVKNLNLSGAVFSGNKECGAVCGILTENGRISNIISNVAVSGKTKTGGICGFNANGVITNCVNYADVVGTTKVGGVVGENWGKIKKSGNRGTVYSTMSGALTFGTGGVAGRSVSSSSMILSCYNTGNVVSTTTGTGGVVGYTNGSGAKIYCSYNTGDVTVKKDKHIVSSSSDNYSGGVVGVAGTYGVSVKRCYNAGEISTKHSTSGGIIGLYDNDAAPGRDENISGNYYLNSGLRGLGSDGSGVSRDLNDGTTAISSGTLINSAAALGSQYVNDLGGTKGSKGYPVLSWQEDIEDYVKPFVKSVPVDVQKKLNKLAAKDNDKKFGEPILMFFDYNIFTSHVLAYYNDHKMSPEKLEKYKEKKLNNK
ncbi:MAG: hypothetical protein PUB09_04420 [Firmicutes bacterium]|nr:hypothetical protein [Bacillota bacterium]